MDKLTFEWIKNTLQQTPQSIIDRDLELGRKREVRRIEREGKRVDERRPYRNTIAQEIGRGLSNGIVYECGRFLEVWISPEKIFHGAGQENSKVCRPKKEGEQSESEENIARRVNHRARKRIRRLVNTNDFRDMLTLTLAPPSVENCMLYDTVEYKLQRNYDHVRGLFKAFVKRCRASGFPLSYVAVFEKHDSERTLEEKRFAWHIHLAVNMQELDLCAIEHEWGHGRVDHQDFRYDKQGVERAEDVMNPGAYMAEYIGKDGEQFSDPLMRGKRRYTTSRDVKRPVQRRIEDCDIDGFFEYILYEGEEYSQEFFTSHHIPGTCKYSVSATYMRRENND